MGRGASFGSSVFYARAREAPCFGRCVLLARVRSNRRLRVLENLSCVSSACFARRACLKSVSWHIPPVNNALSLAPASPSGFLTCMSFLSDGKLLRFLSGSSLPLLTFSIVFTIPRHLTTEVSR